jgi:peptide/nickel transport system permease protein
VDEPQNERASPPLGAPLCAPSAITGTLLSRPLIRRLSGFWRQFRRNKAGVLGLLVVLAFVVVSGFAHVLSPRNPTATNTAPPFTPPSREIPFGTDDLGRDVLSAVIFGIRVSVEVGVFAALTSALIGTLVGAIAGFTGGWVDNLLMRLAELFLSIPRLFLALVIVAIFGTSRVNVIFVIGVLSWPPIARIVRAEFLALREERFVEAARAIGASRIDIAFSEILPNTLHLILITASLQIPAAIIVEAGLSFLGLGDPQPRSLGLVLNDAYPFLRRAWWPAVFPGLALSLITLSFNLAGDALNDAFNPRLKQ